MANVLYILLPNSIQVMVEGKMVSIPKENEVPFNNVLQAIKKNTAEEEYVKKQLLPLIGLKDQMAKDVGSLFEFTDSTVKYKGKILNGTIVDRLILMNQVGLPLTPMTKFLDNLARNPSFRAVSELYNFIAKCNLPITEEGTFLAYKRIRQNWTDKYTGTIDNSIGTIVTMERNLVDDNFKNGCSKGLHFGSKEYFTTSGFGDSDDKLVIVEIDPADVVSVPEEYSFTKGRCCKYKVVEEVAGYDLPEYLKETPKQESPRAYDYDDDQEWEDDPEPDMGYYDDDEPTDEEKEELINLATRKPSLPQRGPDGRFIKRS